MRREKGKKFLTIHSRYTRSRSAVPSSLPHGDQSKWVLLIQNVGQLVMGNYGQLWSTMVNDSQRQSTMFHSAAFVYSGSYTTIINNNQRFSTIVTKVNEGQRRSTKVNEGQRRSTMVNEGQRWSTLLIDSQSSRNWYGRRNKDSGLVHIVTLLSETFNRLTF